MSTFTTCSSVEDTSGKQAGETDGLMGTKVGFIGAAVRAKAVEFGLDLVPVMLPRLGLELGVCIVEYNVS